MAEEFFSTLSTIGQLPNMNLEVRLRFCGNIDKMTNTLSAWLSLIGITRWLSIGNVNGMRYIGYGLTCPLMQVELVCMLAPIIPCFKLQCLITFLTTFMTLMSGYAASLMWMPLWEGDLIGFINTKDFDVLAPTPKLQVVAPAFCGITILSMICIPYLLIMYLAHGGAKNPDLPQGYKCLVFLVWFTWNLFPLWWMMSWEGQSIITDTKFNEIGFTVLNMIAKGSFTLQGFRMGTFEDKRRGSVKDKHAHKGKRGKNGGWSDKEASWDLEDGSPRKNRHVADSRDEFESERTNIPAVISRKSSRKLSASVFVKILRDFDTAPNPDYLGSIPEDAGKRKKRAASAERGGDGNRGHGHSIQQIPNDESPDVHNPWFKSCLQHTFRPVVGHALARAK
uniref:Uncharacterized protein n=1 Tax=Alexandrium catenella TaxID=2925 RepID=A0A7S1R204_ALECA